MPFEQGLTIDRGKKLMEQLTKAMYFNSPANDHAILHHAVQKKKKKISLKFTCRGSSWCINNLWQSQERAVGVPVFWELDLVLS